MTLEWSATLWLVLIVVAGALFAGLIVILARSIGSNQDPQASVIRSWIAITLVIGLLVLSAATFGISDQTLRSTLIGGLTASAGGAIAFYFSSKSADQARHDLIAAAFGNEVVPDLTGKTADQAKAILGGTTLKLSQENPPPDSAAPISSQEPSAGTEAVKASTVRVKHAKKVQVPDVKGRSAAEAASVLNKAGLKLSPENLAANMTVATQAPDEGSEQWEGSTVAVTVSPVVPPN